MLSARPELGRSLALRRLTAALAIGALGVGIATQAGAVGEEPAACGGVDSLSHINNAPLAVDDQSWTSPGIAVVIDVLVNDQDFDGDVMTISDVLTPGHGTSAIVGDAIEYQPGPDFTGDDVFQYVISDGRCGTHQASVRVQVSDDPPPVDEATPDPPIVAPIALTG